MGQAICHRPLPKTDGWADRDVFFSELHLAIEARLPTDRRKAFQRDLRVFKDEFGDFMPIELFIYSVLKRWFRDEYVGCQRLIDVLDLCHRFVEGTR